MHVAGVHYADLSSTFYCVMYVAVVALYPTIGPYTKMCKGQLAVFQYMLSQPDDIPDLKSF